MVTMSIAAERPMSKPTGQTLLLAVVVAASCAVVGYLLVFHDAGGAGRSAATAARRLTLADIPFNGQRAYEYLNDLCILGPRPSDSPGMATQQRMLSDHFKKLGGQVSLQTFRARHPMTGKGVPMANMIVSWHPQRRERILLCAHYDTRPFPDRDPENPRGIFLGANDGASGTALLMELAHAMGDLKGALGIDFVLFDGEEFVFQERDPYFLGSEHFAAEYAHGGHRPRYRAAVLLDMVGDADLQVWPARFSISHADTRPLVEQIWGTARRLGVREFDINKTVDVLDDHMKLHDIGGIPSCDLIDFNYPAWHTQLDAPDRCSALSLAKVGWVVHEWLKQAVRK
jgi:glutaminyl-peptide cyclotransferase